MRISAVRSLTAIAVAGLCGLALTRGLDILRFSMAAAEPESVRPWFATPGLIFDARASSRTVVADRGDVENIRKLRSEIIDILSAKPLASDFWLSLCELQLVLGERSGKVAEAFAFSALTGPNEGYVVLQRVAFGVSYWDGLPPEVKKRTAADLAANSLSAAYKSRVREVLSKQTDKVRQEITTLVEAQGVSPKDLTSIGL